MNRFSDNSTSINSIKAARIAKQYTQAEVADFLNIARTTYTNIENGRSDPDTSTLLKLADFLDCTVDSLLGRTENPPSNTCENYALMDNLRKCREQSKLSQKQVALEIGVKPPTVCQWEKGIKAPSRENISKLAKLYQVSIDYLLGESTDTNRCIMPFARNLKVARCKAGLSQKELSERSGVSQQAISTIENEERSPSEATMTLLANALGYAVSDLVGKQINAEVAANGNSPSPASTIRNKRKSLHLSQARLSKLSGVSQSAISDIENPVGTKRPNTDTIQKIASALQCTISELMGEHSNNKEPTAINGSGLTPDGIRIAGKIDRLPSVTQHEIEKYIDYLLAQALRDP